MTSPKRVSSGKPAGGQFATSAKTPPDLDAIDLVVTEDTVEIVSTPADPQWAERGIGPVDAQMWADRGKTPEQAAAWAREGFDSISSIPWEKNGFDADAAAFWQGHDFQSYEARDWLNDDMPAPFDTHEVEERAAALHPDPAMAS